MSGRAKRKQATVEWTIGEFTVDGGGKLTAPSPERFSSTIFPARAMMQPYSERITFSSGYSPTAHSPTAHSPTAHSPTAHRPTLQSEARLVLDLARWLVISALGFFLITGASPSLRVDEQSVLRTIVQRSLAMEDMAWRSGNEPMFVSLLDKAVPPSWHRSWRKNWQIGQMHASSQQRVADSQIHSVHLSHGIVVVDVQVDRPSNNSLQLTPVIETRFYRHPLADQERADLDDANPDSTNDSAYLNDATTPWIRTAPHPEFWGEESWLETAHLRFDYYAHDAKIIEAAAPQLESIYVEFFRALGEPEPPTDPKLNLLFIQSIDPKWEAPGNVIEMISPTLMKRPPALTATDAFIDTVFIRLSFRAMSQAIPGTRSYWNTIGMGIRTWLRTEITDIPSPWHEQTEQLFYDTLRRHRPLSALDIDDGRRFNLPMNDTLVWQYRVAQSMIEYTITTHGPAAIPRLLEGFSRYRRWGDLIPYVYGIPANEWEAGWNNYLRRDLKLHDDATSPAASDPPSKTTSAEPSTP